MIIALLIIFLCAFAFAVWQAFSRREAVIKETTDKALASIDYTHAYIGGHPVTITGLESDILAQHPGLRPSTPMPPMPPILAPLAVSEAAPDLADKVIKGEITVSKAAEIVKRRKAKAKMETDPDLADDSVVDASEQRAAEGDTMKARAVLAAVSRLDPTELSFIKPDLIRILGIAP